MNKEKWIVLSAALILIAAAAGYLASVKNKQRLGNPGLKMVQQPVLVEKGKAFETNLLETVDLPSDVLDYSATPLPITEAELGWLPKDTTFARRRYVARQAFPIDVSIVLMGRDRTSIHKPEICLTGQGWRVETSELLRVPVSKPHSYDLPILKLIAAKDTPDENGRMIQRRAVYVYWFVSENRLTASHRERVWWMAKDLITTGILQRWAYVACLSICPPGQEEVTFTRIKEFIAASVPEFQLVSSSSSAVAGPATAAILK